MKKFTFAAVFAVFCILVASVGGAMAQGGTETISGTLLSYGSGVNTRTVTAPFTLRITGTTSNEQAQRLLGVLQESGQDRLQSDIAKDTLGNFSVGTQVGQPVNVVRESTVDGRRRIFVVFQRWMQFAELRGGYRSTDYPFGVIEIFLDPATGKGEGTYIAAARIRWDKNNKNDQYQVEIENFATFPARLMGVSSSIKGTRQ
jgi:hypothetical protein